MHAQDEKRVAHPRLLVLVLGAVRCACRDPNKSDQLELISPQFIHPCSGVPALQRMLTDSPRLGIEVRLKSDRLMSDRFPSQYMPANTPSAVPAPVSSWTNVCHVLVVWSGFDTIFSAALMP